LAPSRGENQRIVLLAQNLPPESLLALVDASAAINAAQGLDETLAAIARAAATVMKAQASSVIMLDAARGKQVFRAAAGERADLLVGIEYDQGLGISGKVIETGEPAIVNDVGHDRTHYKDIDARTSYHTRSVIAAPLIHRGRTYGVVEVLNPTDGGLFDERHARLCQVFANLAAIATANAGHRDRLQRENLGLRQAAATASEIVGTSPATQKVKDLIRSVAPSGATVLLLGETGTGKELAARMLHACSDRHDRPLMAVNCAALPETLMESELFGHEAGAFTGASKRKEGLFELAEEGTVFLDEIAEMAPAVQAKLLRVLEEKQVTRVGGTRPVRCDVRVIAATNRDLAAEMEAGRFRRDLFYRLNVFPIEMPPLRARREDIPLLVDHFLKQIAEELKAPVPAVDDEAMAALLRHDYPGNVRELRNVLERACLLGLARGREGTAGGARIGLEHLPPEFTAAAGAASGAAPAEESSLVAQERAMVLAALAQHGWNQTRAAEALHITRDNLRYRMRKYDIRRPKGG